MIISIFLASEFQLLCWQRLHGVENMIANVPLGRLGDENDIKGLAVLLASEAGKHITGQCIAVDGGVSCVIGG